MKMRAIDLEGKTIIVTGGNGLLGKKFCQSLLEYGARVANFDLSALSKDDTDLFLNLKVDLLNRTEVESALSKVVERWGVPHGLINNAALDAPPNAPVSENGPFEDYPESSWDKVMNANVKTVFNLCQLVGKEMSKAGRGSIVNIGSIYGMVSPDQSIYEYRRKSGDEFFKPITYSVSKSAVLNLTRYLAVYWAKKSVRVNTLTFAGVEDNQDAAFLKEYTGRIPMGRMASAQDYVGALVYLLSDSSAYMTGSNMVIDGGWTAI